MARKFQLNSVQQRTKQSYITLCPCCALPSPPSRQWAMRPIVKIPDDWATDTGNMHKKFGKDPHVWFRRATITTVLRPFVRDYPGEPVPEETLTHPPSWSSSNLYQLLLSTTIHSILLVQITCLAIFLHNLSMSSLVYLLIWSPPPHIPYICSPNQCLLFAAHAHTIATCFTVVSAVNNIVI